MKFRTIVKIGVSISVLLFCIAVGFYSFASLKEVGKGKDLDIFSMIPDDCYGILDTDNIDYFTSEFSRMAYSKTDSTSHYSELMLNILSDLNKFTALSPHGIANKVSRIVMSIHKNDFEEYDFISYLQTDKAGKKFLFDLIRQKFDNQVVLKSEKYRGKEIEIYSLGKTSKFLSVLSGDGFIVVSYHKRLIENVIDALEDDTSVRNNEIFSRIHLNKSVNYMTFYSREATFPNLAVSSSDTWSEFELHMNSDVIYLSGGMYQPDSCMEVVKVKLNGEVEYSADSLLIVSSQAKVDSCINSIMSVSRNTIFDECVSNLSKDASYIMVVDMDRVKNNPQKYRGYLPGFIFDNMGFFQSFIISLQITEVNGHFSHIYVFTYKN